MAEKARRATIRFLNVAALLSVATVALAQGTSTQDARAPDACPASGGEKVELAAVEARLELRLADGRLIRLAGLDPASSTPTQPDRDERAQAAFAALIAHHRIMLTPIATAPDRWGRIVASAFDADAPAEPSGLAARALGLGLGRYLPEPAAHACRAALVDAEAQARATRLGLWDDPYYAVLAVDDHAGFAERAGSMVVVEGKATALVTGPYRATLRFTSGLDRSGRGFTATVRPRVAKLFEAGGRQLSGLVGRSLRLRGLLDLRFGPQIELSGPDDLDVLSEPATASVSAK